MINNVLDFIEASAERNPGKVAVFDGVLSLTYAELVERSKRIGSALADKNLIGKPVGVFMEKGADALSTFFGIVYAGGCYSMLNTELPDSRLRQIQSVLQAGYIVTSADLFDKAKELYPEASVLKLEDIAGMEQKEGLLRTVRENMIDTNPLYINFTSGSTGVPKGIAVAHRSVIEFIQYFTDIFGITEVDVIANQAPFDFDVSVKDIYSAMYTGATLVVVPRALFSAPTALLDYLCENRVTTMIWAVSAICLISTFHGLDYKTPETVNKILFSGEVMPYKHLCEWQKHLPDATYVNLYGPTEITCNCTYHILENGRDYSDGIPIGKHFPNEDVFLLGDDNTRIEEQGRTGKIMVRGTALALGYYRMPEKNETSFIRNPLQNAYPELVYSTGDLGMLNERGELVFCGRVDNQIKYMGHRIELEEIERAMSAIDGVDRCICIFDSKKEKLKGYYVGSIEKKELHSTMKATMPVFMVPGFIRKIDEIPLTKNGKVDRKKIQEIIGV